MVFWMALPLIALGTRVRFVLFQIFVDQFFMLKPEMCTGSAENRTHGITGFANFNEWRAVVPLLNSGTTKAALGDYAGVCFKIIKYPWDTVTCPLKKTPS